jgi:hypothetical protein
MAEAESLRQVAQSRAPFSAWIGIVFLFMIFGLIVLALIGPSPRTDNYEQTRAKKRLENLKKLREEDATALTTYAWVDKEKGSAHIPIARAMQLSVKELAQKKPATAYAIATPAPAAPAASASAAPAATASSPTAAANTPASATSSHAGPTSSPKAKEVEGPLSENRNQPAAANNPPNAKPGTQPGASATPQASPAPPSAKPATSPTGTPVQSPPGSPLPVPRKTSMNTFTLPRRTIMPLLVKAYGCC